MDYRVFPCPACREIIDTTMQTCKFCRAAIDPDAAAAAATLQERVQQACGQARSIRMTALAMPLFFLFAFNPLIGVVGLATLIIVPWNVIQWRRRFGSLDSPDPDLPRARRAVRDAALLCAAMVIVSVLWLLVRAAHIEALIIAAIVLVALGLRLAIPHLRASRKAAADPLPGPPTEQPVNMGKELRTRMLALSSHDAGASPTEEFPRVYGVLMDWPVGGELMATVVAFHDGNASLYTTASFGIIGGIGHHSVRTAAIRFVRTANRYYQAAVPMSDDSYPPTGRVRFYLLTFQGVRVLEADLAPLANGTAEVAELFDLGQAVVTELRLVSEKVP